MFVSTKHLTPQERVAVNTVSEFVDMVATYLGYEFTGNMIQDLQEMTFLLQYIMARADGETDD